MKYEPSYRFFCLPVEVDIEDYMEMLQWGNNNVDADTVLPLTTDEVEYYHSLGLWYIIAEQTGYYLLGPGEDDSLHDVETIQKVYNAFLNMDIPKDKNIEKMIYILKYAIDHNRDLFIHI